MTQNILSSIYPKKNYKRDMMKTAEPPEANKVNFQLSHFFKFSIPLSSKQPSRKQHNGLFRLPDMFVCVIQDTDV